MTHIAIGNGHFDGFPMKKRAFPVRYVTIYQRVIHQWPCHRDPMKIGGTYGIYIYMAYCLGLM